MNPEGTADRASPPELDRFVAELKRVYAELDADVALAAPVCLVSGRCCRFAEYGHTLFLSAPEADLLIEEASPPVRPLDDGATCPWQDAAGRCTARSARPLGCRVYFCDETYQEQSYVLSERYIGRLKRLAEEFERPWDYAPLHHHLRRACEDGRYPGPENRPVRDGESDVPAA